jgi:hypothetical protein
MHQNGRNNDPQNIAWKIEYPATQISLKTGDELRYSGLVSSFLPLQQSMQNFFLKKNETPYFGCLNGSYGTALQNIINDNTYVLLVAITS